MIILLSPQFSSHARSQVPSQLRPPRLPPDRPPVHPNPESRAGLGVASPSPTRQRRGPRAFTAPSRPRGSGSQAGSCGVPTGPCSWASAVRPLPSPLPYPPASPLSLPAPRPASSVIGLAVPLSALVLGWESLRAAAPSPASRPELGGRGQNRAGAARARLPRPGRPREEVPLSVSREGRARRPEGAAPRTGSGREREAEAEGRGRGRLRAL
jgi:hypothetical protein